MRTIRKTVLVTLQLNCFNFTIWDFKNTCFIIQQKSDQFDIHYRKLSSGWRQAQCTEKLLCVVHYSFIFSFFFLWYKEINNMLNKIKTKATQMFICSVTAKWFNSESSFHCINVVVACSYFFSPSRSDLSIKKQQH